MSAKAAFRSLIRCAIPISFRIRPLTPLPAALHPPPRLHRARHALLVGALAPCLTALAGCASRGAAVVAPSGAQSAATVSRGTGGLPLPSTRAERTSYLETSSHADVIGFVDSLVAMGAPITVRELARSPMGKVLPMIIASRPRVNSPQEARRLGRPIVYVQANIHAGEVEGKEAVLALLRDWSFGRAPNVLDSLVVIVVPIYNADGNDKLAPQARNRGAQLGPAMIGERPNGAGLDLNRDYVKAEAPETRGSLMAFNAWDPDVFMDLHTTNGSYHGYALTYAPSLHPAAALAPYTADTLLPELRSRMRTRHQFETFPYGNFSTQAGRDEAASAGDKSSWVTYEHKQRYGSNYYGLRGRISILSEAYSHDPFARRVASTRAFVQEALSLVAERRKEIRAHIDAGIAASTFTASNTRAVALRSRFTSRPDTQLVLMEELERRTDTTGTNEPGVPRTMRRTGKIVSRRMPVIDRFEATLMRRPTIEGYVMDGSWTEAARQLRAHGVTVTVLPRAMTASLEVFELDSVAISVRAFQGHREVVVTGRWRTLTRTLPAGTFWVKMATSRDLLAMLLLEPESDDGLLTWNTFDAVLARGKEAPVARLTAPLRLYSPGKSALDPQ